MSFWNSLFNKKYNEILTEEDKKELKEIQRKSYMEEAKKIMEQRGKELAKRDLAFENKKTL